MCHQAIVVVALSWLLLGPSGPGTAHAQRLDWKLEDFRPLTELPWSRVDKNALPPPLDEKVLNRIFREPNRFIRYPVLEAYLRVIRTDDLGRAFDLCIDLEGTQMPDNLVPFFIEIWAARDPKGCWERVKPMFQVVAVEDGWLAYDSWGNTRITVKNLEAVRASKFWLHRESLLTFPLGVESAKVKTESRVHFLREFALAWFNTFESWPATPGRASHGLYQIGNGWKDAESALSMPVANLKHAASSVQFVRDAAFYEIVVRRQLITEPARAWQIVAEIQGKVWNAPEEQEEKPAAVLNEPSMEFLQLWSALDLPAMVKWADSLPADHRPLALKAKGILMTQVDAATRNRWLEEAKKRHPGDKGDSDYVWLLGCWGRWDLVHAFGAALATKDVDTAISVASYALPYDTHGLCNLRLARLHQIARLDIATIPPDIRDALLANFFVFTQEFWGDVQVGETARYGLDILLKTDEVPRDELLKLFAGDNGYGGDGDVLDRTFCALRIWAVTRPDEMRAWLATMKDAEMRTALTWLLENPWGTGEVE